MKNTGSYSYILCDKKKYYYYNKIWLTNITKSHYVTKHIHRFSNVTKHILS